jgi:hypothetical protein
LSFMTEVLTSVEPKWATQSDVAFYACTLKCKSPISSLMLRVSCSTVYVMTYRGKNTEL